MGRCSTRYVTKQKLTSSALRVLSSLIQMKLGGPLPVSGLGLNGHTAGSRSVRAATAVHFAAATRPWQSLLRLQHCASQHACAAAYGAAAGEYDLHGLR